MKKDYNEYYKNNSWETIEDEIEKNRFLGANSLSVYANYVEDCTKNNIPIKSFKEFIKERE